jgi:murein DD-endopeptidase MepM/ murein hydrolase activator NlpD
MSLHTQPRDTWGWARVAHEDGGALRPLRKRIRRWVTRPWFAWILGLLVGALSVFGYLHATRPTQPPPSTAGAATELRSDRSLRSASQDDVHPTLPTVPAPALSGQATPAVHAAPPNAQGAGDVRYTSSDQTQPTLLGAVSRQSFLFGKAKTFQTALERAGVSPAEALAIATSMKGVFDVRRCRPDFTIVVERDAQTQLVKFELHTSAVRHYESVPSKKDGASTGAWTSKRVDAPVERTRMARGGAIETSLGDALEKTGLGADLVGDFVEAFEGKVNFSSDAKKGDLFKIVVDEERIGASIKRYTQALALEWKSAKTGVLRAFWFAPRGRAGEYYDSNGRAMQGGWLRTPVRYDHISSLFDMKRKHPVLKRVVPHLGIDYAAAPGTPVYAAADGRIVFAGNKGANGNLVSIRHDRGFETGYAHLLRIAPGARAGKTVRQKQLIGYVGSTGRSTGPHLHFGLQRGGRFIDPMPYLRGLGKKLSEPDLNEFQKSVKPLNAELNRIPAPHN